MNENQTSRALLGVLLFVASSTYIPWTTSYVGSPSVAGNNRAVIDDAVTLTGSADYGPIWDPPSDTAVRPDMLRLGIEWAVIAAVIGLWIYAGRSQVDRRPVTALPHVAQQANS